MLFLAALIAASPVVITNVKGPIEPLGPICRNPEIVTADAPRDGATVHPLNAEPPAKLLRAVVRTIDGCNKPMVISETIGTPKR